MKFYYLDNHYTQPLCEVLTTLQGCKHFAWNATTLWQPYHNLTRLHQSCCNLEISMWAYFLTSPFVAEIMLGIKEFCNRICVLVTYRVIDNFVGFKLLEIFWVSFAMKNYWFLAIKWLE